MSPLRQCTCGFDPWSVSPVYSADWHRAHAEGHLREWPNVDAVTRANLAQFIADAERKESLETS